MTHMAPIQIDDNSILIRREPCDCARETLQSAPTPFNSYTPSLPNTKCHRHTTMRLINTETLELSEFFGEDIPAYAILSHTWTKEELTLREWTTPSDATPSKAGYKKICMACSLARRYGHAWVWVDTNCIDKTSSAELSEAINSMFEWYRNARVCFVYLEDVTKDSLAEAGSDGGDPPTSHFQPSIMAQFHGSRWFTRGWTLQELIAPFSLIFFSREWAWLGTKADFVSEIASMTGIDSKYLLPARRPQMHEAPLFLEANIATRMSWAARRKTTRIEDMAYCLLGLFDINMPLLYGEGAKAFFRLQEEIIRRYNDHSIFAWGDCLEVVQSGGEENENATIGILAPSPLAFTSIPQHIATELSVTSPYSLTNSGLSIKLPVMCVQGGFIAVLNAGRFSKHGRVGLHLKKPPQAWAGDDGTLSRAAAPVRPFSICPRIYLQPSEQFDLFLRIGDWRQNFGEKPKHPNKHPVPVSSSRCGVMLAFEASAWRSIPSLHAYSDSWKRLPPPLNDNPDDTSTPGYFQPSKILPFPTLQMAPEAWTTVIYPRGQRPPVRVSSTGVMVAFHDLRYSFATSCVFTISIVKFGHGDNEEGESRIIFSHHGIGQLSALSLSTYTPQEWYESMSQPSWKESLENVIRAEQRRIYDLTTHNMLAGASRGTQSEQRVKIGCCNIDHPDFDDLRLAYIMKGDVI